MFFCQKSFNFFLSSKTISNTSFDRHSQNSSPSSSDQKVVISFPNDQYRKRPRSPSPLPIIKRLNDASIQTTPVSSSSRRGLIQTPPTKRITTTATDKETSSKGSLKQTSTSTRVISLFLMIVFLFQNFI